MPVKCVYNHLNNSKIMRNILTAAAGDTVQLSIYDRKLVWQKIPTCAGCHLNKCVKTIAHFDINPKLPPMMSILCWQSYFNLIFNATINHIIHSDTLFCAIFNFMQIMTIDSILVHPLNKVYRPIRLKYRLSSTLFVWEIHHIWNFTVNR